MKRLQRLGATAALWLAAVPLSCAIAQTAAPPARVAASAPPPSIMASAAPTGAPEKRNLTPAESRDSATMAGERRTENPVVAPQISIPLNKSGPTSPKSMLNPPPRAKPAPSGGIDDSAARCAALADAAARDQCRAKLVH